MSDVKQMVKDNLLLAFFSTVETYIIMEIQLIINDSTLVVYISYIYIIDILQL